MKALWYDDAPVSFHGRHTKFAGIDAHPRPARRIPIVIGGKTPGAHKRSIEQGDGWYGFFLDPEQAADQVTALNAAGRRYNRPAALGKLQISITPTRPITVESLRAFADAGVDRLVVYPLPMDDEADVERFLVEQAEIVLG
jgi:alkanesulfonate monooxygenase SsuD/methylene tetrahydromethanopterin reductase-like flavin-dependent oxidoreductase (luciferase family)